jgi:E3 ubiquitin-protein ligase SIAH1
VELIIGGMTVPCSFREHGCTDMIPFAEMLAHEDSCIHAPCYCPVAGCRPYARKSLHQHIIKEHSAVQLSRVTASNLCPVHIHNEESVHIVFLESRGAMFLLLVDRSAPSGRGLSVIHLVTLPAGRSDFKYKIQVYTRSGILCLSGETAELRASVEALPGGRVTVRLRGHVVSRGLARVH